MLDERRWELLIRSLTLASSGAVLALVFGFLAAFFIWCRKRPVRFSAMLLFALPLSPMMYIYALEYLYWLFSLKVPSYFSVVLTYALQLMPLNALAIYNGFLAVSASEIDAARVLRSDIVCLFQIVLRRNLPLMLMLGLFSAVMNLLDYSIPSLFGVPVYSLDIFATFSATGNVLGVAVQSVPIFLFSLAIFIVLFMQLKSVWAVNPQGNRGRCLSESKNTATAVMEAVGGFVWLLPLIAVISAVVPFFTSRHAFTTAILTSFSELQYSLLICAAAAVFGTAMAAVFCVLKGALIPFALAFAAMPPALIGIGLLYTISPLRIFDGILPVIALVLRFFPFAAIIMYISKRMESKEERWAASLFSESKTDWLLRYKIPVTLPPLLISATVIFVLSLGELGATLLVIPPGTTTLTIKLYNYLHYGSGAAVSGLTFMLGVLTALITAAAWGLRNLYFKRGKHD